ncbi:hypothetical protein Q9Q99_13030 [Curtobacterium flaccumfaciens]|nr:hypothetical protein Q9Q99_13030 [Curtobacterium flaccumfaciens]
MTNTYDQRNRLTSTVNTAGGGTVSYGYDLAGNTVKVTDAHGTVTHDYDVANVLTRTTYPTANGGTAKQVYKNDDHGRRTDAWLGAVENTDPTQDPTSWQAHQTITYGVSDHVTGVRAVNASEPSKPVVSLTYCYITGIDAGSDCSATNNPNATDKIQWVKDNITQQTTTYTYDSNGRLTKAAQAGGTTNVTWAYTYDAAGNRLTAKRGGDVTSSQTLTYNTVGQITSDGYAYDGVGNMVKAPGQTFTYNGAQQMTSSTKDGVTTRYKYAGGDMNKLLSQATDGGAEYDYTYGTSDSNGVPVIASRTIAGSGTASVISDPGTGQPLDLQTTDGTTSMWVIDGTGSPAATIADTGKTAYTVSYDPCTALRPSTSAATVRSGSRTPTGSRAASARPAPKTASPSSGTGGNPAPLGRGSSATPSTRPSAPATPTDTHTLRVIPLTLPTSRVKGHSANMHRPFLRQVPPLVERLGLRPWPRRQPALVLQLARLLVLLQASWRVSPPLRRGPSASRAL